MLNKKHVELYMKMANLVAQMSHAKRLQVGSIIVKNNNIIGFGWNGTPSGWDNNCEDKEWMSEDAGGWLDPEEIKEYWPFEANSDDDGSYIGRYRLKTKDIVLHSESNAILKVARSTESSDGADMFCTHAPCLDCAKLIYQSGVKHLYYKDVYRDDRGLKFLAESGVKVTKHDDSINSS